MNSQILINVLYSFSVFMAISLSFNVIYITTKFFHIAHAGSITLGAYFFYFFNQSLSFPVILSFLFSVVLVCALNIAIANFIYLPLKKIKTNSFVFLIISLGIYTIIQNLVSVLWDDDVKIVRTGVVKVGHEIVGAYISDIQIITIVTSVFFVGLTTWVLIKTKLGRQIKAVSMNEVMSDICGINTSHVFLWSFAIGSSLASIAGILVAFDRDITPTMGFSLFLYGIIAMIIGGIGSLWGLVGGSLLLAVAQHLGAYYIDSKWMDAIAYLVLILFLILKPLGFSGKRLKKIEI